MKRQIAIGAALLALGLCSIGAATAQPMEAPLGRGVMPPHQVQIVVRQAGLTPLSWPERRGPVYYMVARDRAGNHVRVFADIYSGRILRVGRPGEPDDGRFEEAGPAPRFDGRPRFDDLDGPRPRFEDMAPPRLGAPRPGTLLPPLPEDVPPEIRDPAAGDERPRLGEGERPRMGGGEAPRGGEPTVRTVPNPIWQVPGGAARPPLPRPRPESETALVVPPPAAPPPAAAPVPSVVAPPAPAAPPVAEPPVPAIAAPVAPSPALPPVEAPVPAVAPPAPDAVPSALFLGVRVSSVPFARAIELGLNPPRGAMIGEIDDRSTVKAAGLRVGDVILQFDGKEIVEAADLSRAVADTPAGKEVEVLIVRKNEGDPTPVVESKFVTVGEPGR